MLCDRPRMTSPAPEPSLDTRRPFTRADAVAAGVAPHLLRGSRFRRLFRGVYVADSVPDTTDLRAQAALRLHPPVAFASHTTAATLHALPVPHDPTTHVSVFDKVDRVQRAGIRAHLSTKGVSVVEVRGTRVSSAIDTFVDLAGVLSLVDLVVLGDAMVRLKLVTVAELVAHCAGSRHRHTRAARRAAAFVRAEVDSPMESRLRMLLVLAGLPEPVVNHTLRDEFGQVIRRFDLSYPALRLIVEYDGRQHAKDTRQWRHDLERREEFDNDGWKLVVVTSEGIYEQPERTVERVAVALRERGVRVRTRSDQWRPHFPGR